jgi:hypothetical protein
MYIIPPYILFMGYIFVYDNVIMLCVTNIIWEEFKVAMSIACINYLKQAELIANVDEDIERFFSLQLYNCTLLSAAYLYFLANQIDVLTASGLIGVFNLLNDQTKYSFIDCENISSSISILLPQITIKGVLLETINKFKNMLDCNVTKTNIYIY